MRYLKRLLIIIYTYLAVFAVAVFVAWLCTGSEPDALIYGVFAGVGVESIIAGIIKIAEAKAENKKENAKDETPYFDA